MSSVVLPGEEEKKLKVKLLLPGSVKASSVLLPFPYAVLPGTVLQASHILVNCAAKGSEIS